MWTSCGSFCDQRNFSYQLQHNIWMHCLSSPSIQVVLHTALQWTEKLTLAQEITWTSDISVDFSYYNFYLSWSRYISWKDTHGFDGEHFRGNWVYSCWDNRCSKAAVPFICHFHSHLFDHTIWKPMDDCVDSSGLPTPHSHVFFPQ